MSPRTRRALCATLGVGLAMPGAAQAAQKTVDMGLPRASQKTFNERHSSDVNDFFPHTVTIHAGDTVRFVPVGFHTVDLPGRRTRALPVIAPTGQAVAGSTDAAGAPFWFNGQPSLGFNTALLRSAFGKRRSYTGAKPVLSGLPLARRPKPLTVRFTRTGSFRYFCDVHYRMTGRVRVVPGSRPVPSAKADAKAVRDQLAAALKVAKSLSAGARTPANTVDVGLEGRRKVSFFGFVPDKLTVPAGTTVNFRMPARSTEIHTATTGPGDPEKEPNSYLGKIAGSLQGTTFDPAALYPSDPPGAPAALTPTFHGNGFWSTGTLDGDSNSPLPPRSSVRFAAPGTYEVYCTIHPFMHGTITVQ